MIERKVKMVRALERGLQVLAEIERRQGANLHELHMALGYHSWRALVREGKLTTPAAAETMAEAILGAGS